MDIQANLKEVIAELPTNVRLVAVSKFHPAEAIEAAYSAGQRIFGESKEQGKIHCTLHRNDTCRRFL